jgi:Family of unknown function (DUF5989)
MSSSDDPSPSREEEFARQAQMGRPGFVSEYLALLRKTGKWWMLPMVLLLLALGALMVLSSTAAAPFIYTLF